MDAVLRSGVVWCRGSVRDHLRDSFDEDRLIMLLFYLVPPNKLENGVKFWYSKGEAKNGVRDASWRDSSRDR